MIYFKYNTNNRKNIIEINNAIELGTERAKKSHNTSPVLTSEKANNMSPKTGIFKLYVYIFTIYIHRKWKNRLVLVVIQLFRKL